MPAASESNLPEGWACPRLGDLVSPSKEKVEPDQCPNAPYLSLEHVESRTGRLLGCGHARDVRSTKTVFRAGDVIYGKLRPYLNKASMPHFDGICSTDFLVLLSNAWLESRLLLWFLLTPKVVEYANHHSTGVQLPRVNFGALSVLEFPLPPLAEQKRIIEKVEQLLARVNAARERLARTRAILKRFRQAVLAAAFSGNLSASWRMTHPDVQKILTASTENGRLPETWGSLPLGDCVHILDHRRVPVNLEDRKKRPGPVPYYGATGQVGWIDDFLFDEELLLVGEDGAPFVDKTKPIAYTISGKSWVNNHAHVLRAKKGVSTNRFLKYFLDWFDFSDYVTGSTRLKLIQAAMGKIPVLLPPLEEQEEIARTIDALFGLAYAADRRAAAAEKWVDKLAQSILAKAFRGELVPTEAELARREGRSYEPAPDLLTRIRASQAPRHQQQPLPRRKIRSDSRRSTAKARKA